MKILMFLMILLVSFIPLAAQDYFPLAVGNTWNYDVFTNINMDVGEASTTVSEVAVISNHTVYTLESTLRVNLGLFVIDSSRTDYVVDAGNDVYAISDLSNVNLLDKFVQHSYNDGDQWVNGGGTTVIASDIGSVTVPAGTFNSCFEVDYGGGTVSIFAPDVGMIKAMDASSFWVGLKNYSLNASPSDNRISFNPQSLILNISPNPASVSANIKFNVLSDSKFKLDIYNPLGELVDRFANPTGQQIIWNSSNLGAGFYMVRLNVADKTYSRKIILIK